MYLNFIIPQIKVRSETVCFILPHVVCARETHPVMFILLSKMVCTVVENGLRFHVTVDLISDFVDHIYILSREPSIYGSCFLIQGK